MGQGPRLQTLRLDTPSTNGAPTRQSSRHHRLENPHTRKPHHHCIVSHPYRAQHEQPPSPPRPARPPSHRLAPFSRRNPLQQIHQRPTARRSNRRPTRLHYDEPSHTPANPIPTRIRPQRRPYPYRIDSRPLHRPSPCRTHLSATTPTTTPPPRHWPAKTAVQRRSPNPRVTAPHTSPHTEFKTTPPTHR